MLILTPNPCLDLTVWVERLSLGSVHRTTRNKTSAGGKGINVARASSALGHPGHLILMLPKIQGDLYKSKLDSENLNVSYIDVAGEVRTAIIVNQESHKDITVINGLGPEITVADWQKYCDFVEMQCQKNELVLLMGSMPPNIPRNGIDQLAKIIHAKGGKILVDTSPGSYKAVSNEILDFITPNLEEAEALIHGINGNLFEINDQNIEQRALKACDEIQGKLAEHVLITAGEFGCAFKNSNERWFLPAFTIDDINYKSAVGAGDSFVAGFACYLNSNASSIDWRDCVKFAMATAAASCESYVAGEIDRIRVEQIYSGKK